MRLGLILLAVSMLIFGTINTITTKYQVEIHSTIVPHLLTISTTCFDLAHVSTCAQNPHWQRHWHRMLLFSLEVKFRILFLWINTSFKTPNLKFEILPPMLTQITVNNSNDWIFVSNLRSMTEWIGDEFHCRSRISKKSILPPEALSQNLDFEIRDWDWELSVNRTWVHNWFFEPRLVAR